MEETCYYDVLGVYPTASKEEIEVAYHHKVVDYTDNNPDDPNAAERFHASIRLAFLVLTNPETKELYDISKGFGGIDLFNAMVEMESQQILDKELPLPQQVTADTQPRDERIELARDVVVPASEDVELVQDLQGAGVVHGEPRPKRNCGPPERARDYFQY